jgi:hypothetical protein
MGWAGGAGLAQRRLSPSHQWRRGGRKFSITDMKCTRNSVAFEQKRGEEKRKEIKKEETR